MGYFKSPEHEPIRVQKLNTLEQRVTVVEATGGGGGGFGVDIDGGDASGVTAPVIELDGAGA